MARESRCLPASSPFHEVAQPRGIAGGSVLGARNLTLAEVIQGKDDGRLPMDDFNTQGGGVRRASGPDGGRAPVQQRFNNVQYFEGTVSALAQGPAR